MFTTLSKNVPLRSIYVQTVRICDKSSLKPPCWQSGSQLSTWQSGSKLRTLPSWCYRTYASSSDPDDFYGVMGLTPTATPEEIKATYFKLSKIYHPDICKDPEGVDKFVRISKAYEVLSNEDKRREYDRKFMNPTDERSGHTASRNVRDLNFDDLRAFQDSMNNPNEPRAKKSEFVTKGKRKGEYDFDEYYHQHYTEERSLKAEANWSKAKATKDRREIRDAKEMDKFMAESDSNTGGKVILYTALTLTVIGAYFGVWDGP